MSSTMAPNVSGVAAPGRRTVYSMCGMCSVRCPIEVTVEDGKVAWVQGNRHDAAIGASLCAKGAAGLPFQQDDERPQTPLIRMGPRGSGQWRRASWDEALDHIADRLRDTVEAYGPRGIALSDRGGFFTDLTRTFVAALGSPNYFNHDATCGGNVHNAARSVFGFSHSALVPDLGNTKHLVLYGRNIVESLMVKEARAFTDAMANGMRVTYIDPRASLTACKASRYWRVRPNSDYALNLALIREVLKQEAYDKDFVARHVTGMEGLRDAVRDNTPEWQEAHTGVPAGELRAFVAEIATQAPRVIFHPGWMTARHKQSFYVSRSALILNALMGNIETPGGFVIAKPPEHYGRKGLKPLAARVAKVTEPRVEGTGVTVAEMREASIVRLAEAPKLTPRDALKFPTPSGKIEFDSAILAKAGLPGMPPYETKTAPTGDRFTLLFGRPATLAHGQSLNNPILREIAPQQLLWIHPERARSLAIRDGDEVDVDGGGAYVGRIRAKVTPWIHPEAVFMLHGYGATVPLATRALGVGVADQRLQHGKLYEFDPAGGGNALTETIVRIRPAAAGGAGS